MITLFLFETELNVANNIEITAKKVRIGIRSLFRIELDSSPSLSELSENKFLQNVYY